jgi:uncharacterized protein YndB with AHSA1/START domain
MSPSKKYARSGTRGYAHLAEIRAPAARVWRALTDPALIRIWSGSEAEIDPRKHGLYRLGRAAAGGREAHIDIFEVNRRLRIIYMPGPDMPPCGSAIVDDFMLDSSKGAGMVTLRLLGSGFPDSKDWDRSYVRIRVSWERFLGRIKNTLENPPRPRPAAKPVDPPLPGLDF